jgi:hypothetical protein
VEMEQNMLIKSMFSSKLDYKYYLMLGKDIIVVFLHMGKPEQVNHTLWLAMEQTKVSCQYLVNKFLGEFLETKIKINSMKFVFLCLKFTMRKFRIY